MGKGNAGKPELKKKLIFPGNARIPTNRPRKLKATTNIFVSYQFRLLVIDGSEECKSLKEFETHQKFQRR